MPKISALPAGTAPTGAELVPAVQGGVTKEFTFAQVTNSAAPSFDTKAGVQSATISAVVSTIRTGGYTTAGDGGGALYKRGTLPAHAGYIQSADGAYWVIADQVLKATSFGAIGDDSTNNQTALTNWLAACSVLGRPGYLPAGIHRHSAPLTQAAYVRIFGDTRDTSILKITSATGDQLTLGWYATAERMSFGSTVPRISHSNVVLNGAYSTVKDFGVTNYFWAVSVTGSANITLVKDGQFNNPASASSLTVQYANSGVAHRLEECIADGGGGADLPFAHVLIHYSGDITMSNCQWIRAAYGLYSDPTTGQELDSLRVNQTYFDNCSVDAVSFNPTGTGIIGRSDFEQCWMTSAGSNGLTAIATGSAIINGISTRGCHILGNGGRGIYGNGVGVFNLESIDNDIAGNVVAGIDLNNVSSARATGRVGPFGGFGANGIGLRLTGTTDNVYTDGLDLRGNTIVSVNTASGTNNVLGFDTVTGNPTAGLEVVSVTPGAFPNTTAQGTAVTANAKGLVTALSVYTITPDIDSVTSLGANVGAFLKVPSSANLRSALTDETGTGAAVFGTSPTIATPTLSGLITASGGQIAFPASQNASADPNTLDDYEEGTWTPSVTFATPGDLAVTYGLRDARYTKVGRVVHVSFAFVVSSFTYTTASGNITITGLPFASNATANSRWYSPLLWQGIAKAGYTQMTGALVENTTQLVVLGSGSGVVASNVTTTDSPSTSSIIFGAVMSYTI
jgi:hypothetical protein